MANIGVQILSREIKRLKGDIHQARREARRYPACAAMLKGRVMAYRRNVKDCALVLKNLLDAIQSA